MIYTTKKEATAAAEQAAASTYIPHEVVSFTVAETGELVYFINSREDFKAPAKHPSRRKNGGKYIY